VAVTKRLAYHGQPRFVEDASRRTSTIPWSTRSSYQGSARFLPKGRGKGGSPTLQELSVAFKAEVA